MYLLSQYERNKALFKLKNIDEKFIEKFNI